MTHVVYDTSGRVYLSYVVDDAGEIKDLALAEVCANGLRPVPEDERAALEWSYDRERLHAANPAPRPMTTEELVEYLLTHWDELAGDI